MEEGSEMKNNYYEKEFLEKEFFKVGAITEDYEHPENLEFVRFDEVRL